MNGWMASGRFPPFDMKLGGRLQCKWLRVDVRGLCGALNYRWMASDCCPLFGIGFDARQPSGCLRDVQRFNIEATVILPLTIDLVSWLSWGTLGPCSRMQGSHQHSLWCGHWWDASTPISHGGHFRAVPQDRTCNCSFLSDKVAGSNDNGPV